MAKAELTLPEYLEYVEAHANAAEIGNDLKTAEIIRTLVRVVRDAHGLNQVKTNGE